MHISKEYITDSADQLLRSSRLANQAYTEITSAVEAMVGRINNSSKNGNGVVPIKEGCYQLLEEEYHWYREKPLNVLSSKGGPIDVYKEFHNGLHLFRVGLEFETGNISSAHRSMNKLSLGIQVGELDLAVILLPIHELSYYLTDRVSNYEELEPYFSLVEDIPFIVIGFDAEEYTTAVDPLPKGKDGMSDRAIHRWKNAH